MQHRLEQKVRLPSPGVEGMSSLSAEQMEELVDEH